MAGLFGAHKATTHATRAMGIDFQGAQYGSVVPVVYGRNKVPGNCVWYGDFQSHAQQQKAGKGGGGGSTTNYTYSASAQMGLCEGPGIGLQTVYDGTSVVNLSSINYAFASGAKGQAPWSHLSGSAALGYSLTALFSFQNLDLGSQASLPNYNYEVNALKQFSGGIPDANPRDILSDICGDPYHGVNFPFLGDLTQYSNYCVANSLFLSPVYDQQQTANQALSDLFKYTNAYVYYSEDQLKVVPLGDTAVTGNGVTFTPNVTPVVNLGTDDFIADGSGATITVDRKAPQDNLNLVRVEFKDRSNTYHDSAVVGAIDEDIITNGGRSDDSETINGCTTSAVARFVAQNLVQRAFYIRNTYQFKLTWRFCYLEPTDIVTLTDAALGLSLYPVRITEIEEDGDSALTITAEEFPEGIGHSAIYNTQPNGGTNIDQNSDPGAVNPPFLFRGPGFLVTGSNPEIWCAVNGSNAMWAACEVYLSHDGTSYTFAGTVASQARYGSLTAALAAGTADPDITNTPTVQVYAPGELLGGSQTDADNFVTLAMVDTEVIAYETATLQAANTYKLGYLRRGGYGSGNVAHSSGAPFVRLDDSIFRIPVDPSLIGSTVYLKFLSINAFGRTPRTLADETAYTYVVGTNVELPDVPPVPSTFSVLGVADAVSITWTNDNPAAVGCTSIERASASGGPWSVLAQVGPTTTAYHDSFTTGATYYYRARARGPLVQSGWSAYTDVFNSTGVDVSKATIANVQTLLNGNFLLGLSNWIAAQGWTSDATPRAIYTGFAGANGTLTLANTNNVPCQPGSQIIGQALLSSNSANGACYAGVEFLDSSQNHLAYAFGNSITGTTVATLSRKVAVAPAGAAFARFFLGAANCTAGTYYAQSCLMTVTLSSVDELPDGTGRFAVVNGGNLKGVSSVDTNNRAGIDFTQSLHVGKSLANIPDDPTSTRYAVSNIDGNRRALIDATQGGHVGAWNLDSRVADGTNFQRVGTGYADTSGRVVNLWDGTAVRSAVNTWDGANRARTGLQSSGVLVAGLHPVDNLKDGTYARPLATALQSGVPLQMTGGKNLLPNGSFSSNLTGTALGSFLATGASASDGWTVASISSAHGVLYESSSAGRDILIRLKGGSSIPANTELDTYVGTAAKASVTGGAPFAFTFNRDTESNVALPAGVTVTLRTYIAWYRGDGSVTNTTIVDQGTNSVAKVPVTITGTVPSDAVSAAIVLQAIVTNVNGTATAVGTSGQLPADMRWYNVALVMASDLDKEVSDGTTYLRMPGANMDANRRGLIDFGQGAHLNKILDNIGDGATYGRPANADLYSSGGVNRIGLRIAGSGQQVGDQRNLLPITVASLRSVLNTSPITYTITSGSPNSTVNFSVAAFTLQAGSASINYNAASHAIAQANGTTTTWYLLFIDPGYAGGTQSLFVTTSPTVAAQYDGAVNIGSATVTVASGGGGSSGSGSGGGGWCVCDDMWIDGGTQAKDARPGHAFDCCDLPTRGTETFKRALQSVEYHYEQCVRLTTEGGAVLDCGHTTPFDTVDGCTLRAPDMQGELVLTDHGLQKVVDVEWIGMRHVCYFHFGGISYAAGRDTRPWWLRVLPQRLLPKRLRRNVIRIYSHNAVSKP